MTIFDYSFFHFSQEKFRTISKDKSIYTGSWLPTNGITLIHPPKHIDSENNKYLYNELS